MKLLRLVEIVEIATRFRFEDAMKKLKVGQKVKVGSRHGVVSGYNQIGQLNDYVTSKPEIFQESVSHGLLTVDSFYPADRYPYRIKFEDGYEDVYGTEEIEVV